MNKRKKIRFVNIKQIDNGYVVHSYVGAESPKDIYISEEQEKFCKTFTDALDFASEIEIAIQEYDSKLEEIVAV